MKLNGGEYRNRTGVHGFAIRPAIQGNQRATVSKEAPTNRELSAKVSRVELTGANENPGATAIATGAKDVVEASSLPPVDSPEWAGAPAIILRHFCGVAA